MIAEGLLRTCSDGECTAPGGGDVSRSRAANGATGWNGHIPGRWGTDPVGRRPRSRSLAGSPRLMKPVLISVLPELHIVEEKRPWLERNPGEPPSARARSPRPPLSPKPRRKQPRRPQPSRRRSADLRQDTSAALADFGGHRALAHLVALVGVETRLRIRIPTGVTSTISSSMMKSRHSSSDMFRGGTRRMVMSSVEERMLVFCFCLVTFTAISPGRRFWPTIMPSYTLIPGPIRAGRAPGGRGGRRQRRCRAGWHSDSHPRRARQGGGFPADQFGGHHAGATGQGEECCGCR